MFGKKISQVVLLASAFCLSIYSAQAQIDEKMVRKEWKARLKATDPLEFKTIVEERDQLKTGASAKQAELDAKVSEVTTLKTANDRCETEKAELDTKLKTAEQQLADLLAKTKAAVAAEKGAPKAAAAAKSAAPMAVAPKPAKPAKAAAPAPEPTEEPETTGPGVTYKVQIGAFKNKDLTKYFGTSKNFSGEVDADGTKKYTICFFKDYWEADNFKKYIREMGVKDAWVVAYKEGKRIPLKDALEGAAR